MQVNKEDVKIKIVGVGGGGRNAVGRMIEAGISGVDYVSINTDDKGYNSSSSETKIQIGKKETQGRGAGGNPERGTISANENQKEIQEVLSDCDMVFITAGMGGGTGTGASPVIAKIAKELGILTVAVVTTPFSFEGKKRMDNAVAGIEELKKYADGVVVVPNDNLKKISDVRLTLANAFEIADSVLMQTVKNILDIVRNASYINCDFSDICSVVRDSKSVYTVTGFAEGVDRSKKIVTQISSNVLLGTSVEDMDGILIYIIASDNILLEETDKIIASVLDKASENAFVIHGVNFDESMDDGMKVVLLATKKRG